MKQLAEYGPLGLFFAVFFLSDKNLYHATAALMLSYSIGMLILWKLDGKLSNTHKIMWLAIMLFGGLTLFLKNEMFIKWKPTIANTVMALVFLGSHYIGQKKPLIQSMLESNIQLKTSDWLTLSKMWVAFFLLTGVANLYVAYHYPTDFWVKFKVFGLIGITLIFSVIQGIWLMRKVDFTESDVSAATDTTDMDNLTKNSNNAQYTQGERMQTEVSDNTPLTRLDIIRNALLKRFVNADIELTDESHLHAGHAGAEDGRGHFRLQIISDEFKDVSRIRRHQLVYASLGDLMQSDIHALTISASTSEELF